MRSFLEKSGVMSASLDKQPGNTTALISFASTEECIVAWRRLQRLPINNDTVIGIKYHGAQAQAAAVAASTGDGNGSGGGSGTGASGEGAAAGGGASASGGKRESSSRGEGAGAGSEAPPAKQAKMADVREQV
jgi:hypothetical protein